MVVAKMAGGPERDTRPLGGEKGMDEGNLAGTTARVHPLDGPLLACARAMLSGEGGMPSLPLPRVDGKPVDTLSHSGSELLRGWLKRSVPRLLARHGGGLIRPWPEKGSLVRAPLWQRVSALPLNLHFGHPAWEVLRWLCRVEITTNGLQPAPPTWEGQTGQAFLMWRMADSLSANGHEGILRTACLQAWNPHHLLLWLGYPQAPAPEGSKPWQGWQEEGWLAQLEGCQSWLRRRWTEEWTDLALSASNRNPGDWLARLESLCKRAVAWLDWAGSPEGRWDLAGPLYQSLCPPADQMLLDAMERLKPELFRGGLSSGQESAARYGSFSNLAENLARRHQDATGRLYYDEDHAPAQALVHLVARLPGVPRFADWISHLVERVRMAQQP